MPAPKAVGSFDLISSMSIERTALISRACRFAASARSFMAARSRSLATTFSFNATSASRALQSFAINVFSSILASWRAESAMLARVSAFSEIRLVELNDLPELKNGVSDAFFLSAHRASGFENQILTPGRQEPICQPGWSYPERRATRGRSRPRRARFSPRSSFPLTHTRLTRAGLTCACPICAGRLLPRDLHTS